MPHTNTRTKGLFVLTVLMALTRSIIWAAPGGSLENNKKNDQMLHRGGVNRVTATDLSDKQTLIQVTQASLNSNDFDTAFILCAEYQKRFPQDPIGYLAAANASQVMMRDYRVRIHEERFEREVGQAIRLAQFQLKKEKSSENYFLLASAQGYLSFHQFRKGEWFRSLKGALRTIQHLKRAYSIDRNFVDPLLGLALYEYGKSKVPLLRGDLDKAILYLEKVENDAEYVAVDAMYSMQLIHYQEADFERALMVNERIYNRFPESPVCLYNRALLLEETGHPEQAVEVWQNLITVIEDFVAPSMGYLAECHYRLSNIYMASGNLMQAEIEVQRASDYASSYKADQEMDGPYVTFRDVEKGIRKLHQSF